MHPSRPNESLIQTLEVTRPFEAVSTDIGYYLGDNYLVLVQCLPFEILSVRKLIK